MADIDTTPALGGVLRQESNSDKDFYINGTTSSRVVDDFSQALDETYLNKSLKQMDDVLGNDQAGQDALVGAGEGNAYLGAFQAQHFLRNRTRVRKWADALTVAALDAADDGLIEVQLKKVGITTDPIFNTDLLQIGDGGSE